jgi:hypothetical protein
MANPPQDPTLRPMKETDVKFHVRNIVWDGEVGFTKHARTEMANDDMSVADCMNLLRAGIIGAAEWENGEYRYHITTPRMCIVISFQSPTRLTIVTAWRIQ